MQIVRALHIIVNINSRNTGVRLTSTYAVINPRCRSVRLTYVGKTTAINTQMFNNIYDISMFCTETRQL